MSIKNWGLFTHELDQTHLRLVLQRLWGIECPHMPKGASIEAIYERTKEACLIVGGHIEKSWVTDEDYFSYLSVSKSTGIERVKLKEDAYKLDYLVLDTLFLLQKAGLDPINKRYRSLAEFSEIDCDYKEQSYYNKKIIKYFSKRDTPFFLKNFGIERSSEDSNYSNYRISKFLDRLLMDSLKTIEKNPYTNDRTWKQIRYFFKNCCLPFVGRIKPPEDPSAKSAAPNNDKYDVDRLLTYYAIERLYDVGSMVYLVLNQEKMTGRFQHLLDLVPSLYFVPNPQGKDIYLDLLTRILNLDDVVTTRFDWWNNASEEVIASKVQRFSDAEVAAENLIIAGEYLSYLAQVYYPVLTATFYVAFADSYEDEEESKNALIRYAKDHDLLNRYEERLEKQGAIMMTFKPKEWEMTAEYYSLLRERVWLNEGTVQQWKAKTTVDYLDSRDLYLDQLLKTLIREKVEFKRFYEPQLV